MTLYELLHKVSFDEIAPFLSKSYTEGKPLAPFKMHYVNVEISVEYDYATYKEWFFSMDVMTKIFL